MNGKVSKYGGYLHRKHDPKDLTGKVPFTIRVMPLRKMSIDRSSNITGDERYSIFGPGASHVATKHYTHEGIWHEGTWI